MNNKQRGGRSMTTLTPEKLDEIERALQVKLDAEKRLRANLTSKNLAALDAADAQLGVLLDDNAEELVRLAKKGAGFMEIMNFKDKGDNFATVQLLRNLAWEDLPEIRHYKEPPK